MKKAQKIMCATLVAALTSGSVFALAACNPEKKPLTDEPLNATKIADYTTGVAADRAETFASGSKGYSWENGEPFNVWWKPDLVTYADNKMSLALAEMTEKEQVWNEEKKEYEDCVAEYYGAEARTEHYYGYGDFQVRMKPAKIVGTASTFFTCTGPYDVWYEDDGETVKRKNDHDEIDIEFLGKDTTKVQFNYFASGVGGHEYMYDLGFDASLEYHDYGFRWTETYITWFVDEKPVYRVDRANIKKGEAWPEDPGRIIMNYWCGTQEASGWMGKFNNDYSGRAEYLYASASGEAQPDPNTAHIKETPPEEIDVPTTGWTDISVDGFVGWDDNYDVDTTDGLTIFHESKRSDWACGGMDLADSYSWVKFKVKNNADVPADARIDIKNKSVANGGAVEAISPSNDNVKVLTADSAAFIHLDAGEELEVAVKIKNIVINQFVVFLNSTVTDRAETGSITITELKGIINNSAETPDAPTVNIGDHEVSFGGAGYTITPAEDKSSMTVEYSGIGGNNYNNINTSISDFVGDNNMFTVTIKNEGTDTVKIRMDIGCDVADGSSKTDGGKNPDGKNNFCNISAEYVGTTVSSGKDYDYGGGDWVQIATGETVTVKIKFTANVAKDVKFFIDSSTWDDETTHSGKVVFSNMSLSKVEGAETPAPTTPEDGWVDISVEGFDGWGIYDIDKTEGLTISHNSKIAELYKPCGMDIADYGWIKFKIKNNKEIAAVVKIDFKPNGAEGEHGGGVKAVIPASGKVFVAWGDAVQIYLDAEEELEIIVEIKPDMTINQMTVLLNDVEEPAEGERPDEGSITISELQGVLKESTPVEGGDDDTQGNE